MQIKRLITIMESSFNKYSSLEMPPNSFEEVASKRGNEEIWANTNYKSPTFYV